jgi:hypothetical protein
MESRIASPELRRHRHPSAWILVQSRHTIGTLWQNRTTLTRRKLVTFKLSDASLFWTTAGPAQLRISASRFAAW